MGSCVLHAAYVYHNMMMRAIAVVNWAQNRNDDDEFRSKHFSARLFFHPASQPLFPSEHPSSCRYLVCVKKFELRDAQVSPLKCSNDWVY